jgi:spermidine synthase
MITSYALKCSWVLNLHRWFTFGTCCQTKPIVLRRRSRILILIYFIFFLSGAAALIYELLWVRYLSLIFGGSHLAVTTILSVFMGGLALGSYIISKRAGRHNLLRLYGLLELGIALSAIVFVVLINLYPLIYIPLARIADGSPIYLTFLRVTFSIIALIVPTTLMGGTLPVLSSFTQQHHELGSRLSFLYGFNTLGAVIGAAATGFFILPHYSVSTTLAFAVTINLFAGVSAIALQKKIQLLPDNRDPAEDVVSDTSIASPSFIKRPENIFALKLVLWGIGMSGFCALAYEVLWTRILSIVIGASVYGFTLLLVAFLAGIGLGSAAYGLYLRMCAQRYVTHTDHTARNIIGFGLVQVIIGVSALLVTMHLRNLPSHAVMVYDFLLNSKLKFNMGNFKTRQLAHFIIAFSYLFVPAFFMGVAFPLAGKIHGQYKKAAGRAVGEVLFYNTIGAILGSSISGFVLIYFLGIQLSLQLIILINIGFGLFVMVSVIGNKLLNWATPSLLLIAVPVLIMNPTPWKLWDTKYYAVYQSNNPEMYSTPDKVKEVLENTDILYYGEGIQAIISSLKAGAAQFFITNGRVEASNSNEGMQCQYTLGHLPMLLNHNPKKVFVLGTGSGMTLGATSVHPSVEQITLAEIEPKVLNVAKTFGIYNHYVLNNPKLKIVFNDGRNFLMTTKEKFDVITADPIHPWFSGTGYLYSTEYFKLAAEHLNPGGMVCQWLPIYELSEDNLKSIVKTFHENFRYIMIWLTYDDAELVGSNLPIIIDKEELESRIKVPEVLQDLERVKMGSAKDFLSYFVMGTKGAEAYCSGGRVNTDDNLYLEFSAPHSIGKTRLMGDNVYTLVKYRESILPYLRMSIDQATNGKETTTLKANFLAAGLYDQAHILHLTGRSNTPEYEKLSLELNARYPTYAPWKFLRNERPDSKGGTLKLLKQIKLTFTNEKGELTNMEFSAVIIRSNEERARIFFVDNSSRIVFGKLRIRGANKELYIEDFVENMMKSVQGLYKEELRVTHASGGAFPSATSVLPRIKHLVEANIDDAKI